MRGLVERHPLAVFFVCTFASTWTLWIVSGVLGRGDPPILDSGWLIAQVGVFCPSLWALVLTGILRPEQRRHTVRVILGVFLPAAGLGIAVAFHQGDDPSRLPAVLQVAITAFALAVLILFVISRRIALVERDTLGIRTLAWSVAAALVFPALFAFGWWLVNRTDGSFTVGALGTDLGATLPGLIVLLCFDMVFGGALGEEIGWRGFALPRLLRRETPVGSALTLGLLWSLWHLPIDLTSGFGLSGVGGVLSRLLFTCALSVIVTYFFVRSGHGLLTSLLIHATLNWLPVLRFDRYTAAMVVLFVLMFLGAMVIAVADERMRVPLLLPTPLERQLQYPCPEGQDAAQRPRTAPRIPDAD